MTLDRIASLLNDLLGLVLIARLLALRLHRVYQVFCLFIFVGILGSALLFVNLFDQHSWDYRVLWLATEVPAWITTLWMVYALLGAVLATLPGILRFSRRILNATFGSTIAITLLTAKPEFAAAHLSSATSLLEASVRAGFVLDRVISTLALIILLAILGFVLWFPVQMPRNLVLFSFGFISFFGIRTALLLAHDFLGARSSESLSVVDSSILSACFLYWVTTLTREGEKIPLRIGHRWEKQHQQRLLQQLEAMNASLFSGTGR